MSILLQLNEALSKREQNKLMREWREMSAELAVFALITKKMTARVGEIEKSLMPVVKEAENQKEVIDNAILEYQHSKGKSSVSYSELFNEALRIATADQKVVLEAYKKSISKVGEGKEGLSVCDPKLEKIIAGINKDMTINELKQKLVEIAKLPDNEDLHEASVIASIKNALRKIVDAFKPVADAQKVSGKSAAKLLAISQQPAA